MPKINIKFSSHQKIHYHKTISIKSQPNFGKSYEPKYRCELCDVTAEIDPIYQHLVGHRHRKAYLEEILGKKGIDLKEDSKRYARKWDDKNPKQLRYIESNSQYEAVMPSTQVDKERLEGKGIIQFPLFCRYTYYFIISPSTPKLRFSESRFSEILGLVNKCQLP